MSDLVGNPEDRFSRVAAHMEFVFILQEHEENDVIEQRLREREELQKQLQDIEREKQELEQKKLELQVCVFSALQKHAHSIYRDF